MVLLNLLISIYSACGFTARAGDDSARYLLNASEIHLYNGQFQSADSLLSLYRKSYLRQDRSNPEDVRLNATYFLQFGILKFNWGAYIEAIQELGTAKELFGHSGHAEKVPDADEWIGSCYLKLGSFHEAVFHYNSADSVRNILHAGQLLAQANNKYLLSVALSQIEASGDHSTHLFQKHRLNYSSRPSSESVFLESVSLMDQWLSQADNDNGLVPQNFVGIYQPEHLQKDIVARLVKLKEEAKQSHLRHRAILLPYLMTLQVAHAGIPEEFEIDASYKIFREATGLAHAEWSAYKQHWMEVPINLAFAEACKKMVDHYISASSRLGLESSGMVGENPNTVDFQRVFPGGTGTDQPRRMDKSGKAIWEANDRAEKVAELHTAENKLIQQSRSDLNSKIIQLDNIAFRSFQRNQILFHADGLDNDVHELPHLGSLKSSIPPDWFLASTDHFAQFLQSTLRSYPGSFVFPKGFLDFELEVGENNPSDIEKLTGYVATKLSNLMIAYDSAATMLRNSLTLEDDRYSANARMRNFRVRLFRSAWNGQNWQSAFAYIEESKATLLMRELSTKTLTMTSTNPAINSTGMGSIVSLDSLQKHLKQDEALVNFMLDNDRIYWLIVTPLGIEHDEVGVNEEEFQKRLKAFRNGIVYDLSDSYFDNGYWLYKRLFRKIEKLNIHSLVLIPDGDLGTIPFEAMLTANVHKNSRRDYFNVPYLINKYAVSYHYSASLYFISRHNVGPDKWKKTMAGYAPFVTHHTSQIGSVQFPGNSNAPDTFQDLPFSEKELESLSALLQKSNFSVNIVEGKEATEGRIKTELNAQYSILHFATHAFVNADNPSESGLALSPDDSNDGILYFNEIKELPLGAQLVVLSACETASGKLYLGEGIVGLTSSFILTGSKNILSSLWKVTDESTSILMTSFYKRLLSEPSNRLSEHLRDAKFSMIHSGTYSRPYYWAPFVLIGR